MDAWVWGNVRDGGNATGLFRELAEGRASLAAGHVYAYHDRHRVARLTSHIFKTGGMTFVAPKPRLRR